jgi:hypothetical protein
MIMAGTLVVGISIKEKKFVCTAFRKGEIYEPVAGTPKPGELGHVLSYIIENSGEILHVVYVVDRGSAGIIEKEMKKLSIPVSRDSVIIS